MQEIKYGCGIDIAKDKFNACLSGIDTTQQVRIRAQSSFPNTVTGFAAFLAWALKHAPADLPLVFLMEATGIYYEQLAWYLHNGDRNVAVVLPNKAKKYKDSLGMKSKNDQIDAQALAAMCCERHHSPWKPLTKNIYGLRILTRQVESLAALKTAASNQLQALHHGMYRDPATEKMLQKQLALYEKQKAQAHQRIEQLIAADPQLKRKFDHICAIKGLGLQSLAVIVAETAGFAAFENAAQLVSYAGYDVVENQSGTSAGKTRISKKGNNHIRRAMHFAAFNMVRYEVGGMVALYHRIYERSRIKMKAYTAVQKKLLTLIYTLWKKDEAFDPAYQQATAKKETTSGEKEPAPSLATAVRPEHGQGQGQEQQKDLKKVIPATGTGITQDRHPSKPRRMPSLAETNLIT